MSAAIQAFAPQLYDALKRITHPMADDGGVQHALDVLSAVDAEADDHHARTRQP